MSKKKKALSSSLCQKAFWMTEILIYVSAATAQVTQRVLPEEWSELVEGGKFMDRFEVMPRGITGNATWGCREVQDRYTDNGIEFPDFSVWGGNILKGDDGLYHLFACGWPENSPGGHMFWPNSTVFHAISHTSYGPYTLEDYIGKGHNPEAFRLDNGRWVVYVIDGFYIADSPYGPWTRGEFQFDARDRNIIEGLSNLTFARRQDGSKLMVCRGGGIWISKDGLSPYMQITDARVYPDVEGRFEDPVVWRDDVQYHLIVNDWLGRIAWYLRSADGIHWVTEPGEAYVPGITRHDDGTVEQWFKYERAKVLQDKFGRVEQMNFAVIDTIKWDDLPDDNHSSKNVCVPMNKGLLLSIRNIRPVKANTRIVRLFIRDEDNFNAYKDLDIASLRFGSYKLVNFGGGAKAISVRHRRDGVVVRFRGRDMGINADEFAPKLLGRTKTGRLVYGYSRLPGYNYMPAILSSRQPILSSNHDSLTITVENFGLSTSKRVQASVYADDAMIGTCRIQSLAPYGADTQTIPLGKRLEGTRCWTVKIEGRSMNVTNRFNEKE